MFICGTQVLIRGGGGGGDIRFDKIKVCISAADL